jgi:hypothetical protein
MSRTVITNLEPRKTIVYAKAAPGARGPGTYPITMSIRGTLVVGIGIIPFPIAEAATILKIIASVGTAPTGASLKLDVLKNGVSILTSFIEILAGQTVSAVVIPADTDLQVGDKLTVDVKQIGSIIAGAYATINIEVVNQ